MNSAGTRIFPVLTNAGFLESEIKKLLDQVEKALDYKLDDEVLFQDLDGPPDLNKQSSAAGMLEEPPGKPGLRRLLSHSGVIRLERRLRNLISSDKPSGLPMNSGMSQITMWDRSSQYKQELLVSYFDALKETKQLFERLASGEKVPFLHVENLIVGFWKSLVIDKAVLLNLASIRLMSEKEDYLFSHALNVCLIALNIAAAQGYNQDQVLEIAESALLSDVGMMLVPREIRFKKRKLTEEDIHEIRKHPVHACHLLDSVEGIPESVVMSAYQHHERQSGTGYPKKQQGRLIHQYAQMVSIADIYDAISSRRIYRNAHIPYHAMEIVLKMANKGYLNNQKVRNFIRIMSLFPIGSLVKLNSGRIGKVVAANEAAYTRPVVSILTNEKGNILGDREINELDLCRYDTDEIILPLKSDVIRHNTMTGF